MKVTVSNNKIPIHSETPIQKNFGKKDLVLWNNPYEIHMKIDPPNNLFAIIAVDTRYDKEVSFGGTRFAYYNSTYEAIEDAKKLAYSMSYKALFTKLPFRGSKVVLMRPRHSFDRKNYFLEFGKYIDSFKGKLFTGCDVGTTQKDMEIASLTSKYIINKVDPLSIATALSVKEAIMEGVNFKLGKEDLKDLRVLVQGIGKVGRFLALALKEAGARVSISDLDQKLLGSFAQDNDFEAIDSKSIFKKEYDVFAPSAIGGVINPSSLRKLKCKILCGAANNVLATPSMDLELHTKGILYIPDFIANVGGALVAGLTHLGKDETVAENWIKNTLPNRLRDILIYASKKNLPTEYAAKYILGKNFI